MNYTLSRTITEARSDVFQRILKGILLIYRRYLQAQIKSDQWNPYLSAKLDALEILLDR